MVQGNFLMRYTIGITAGLLGSAFLALPAAQAQDSSETSFRQAVQAAPDKQHSSCKDRTDDWVAELPGFTKNARFALNNKRDTALVFEGRKFQLVDVVSGKPKTPKPNFLDPDQEIVDVVYSDTTELFDQPEFTFSDGNFYFAINNAKSGGVGHLTDPLGEKRLNQKYLDPGTFGVKVTALNRFDGRRLYVVGTISDGSHWLAYWNKGSLLNSLKILDLTEEVPIHTECNKDNTCGVVSKLGSRLIFRVYLQGIVLDTGASTWDAGGHYGSAHVMDPYLDKTMFVFTDEDGFFFGWASYEEANSWNKVQVKTTPLQDAKPSIHLLPRSGSVVNEFFTYDGATIREFNSARRIICTSKLNKSRTLASGFRNFQVTPLGDRDADYLGTALSGGKLYMRRIVKPKQALEPLVIFGN